MEARNDVKLLKLRICYRKPKQTPMKNVHTLLTPLQQLIEEFGGDSGVPARCAGDSSIRRMVSFRKTEGSIVSFRSDEKEEQTLALPLK
ncbi:hypothetical protein LXL04_002174 [Taraxacum kok-saghyz]